MKVLVVDPSLFTLPYDLAFCRALGKAGAETILVGRPLRALERMERQGFAFAPLFYRRSDAGGGGRALLKGLEHAAGLVALERLIRRERPDAVHLQWLALPLLDRLFLTATKARTRLVFTAHNSGSFHASTSRFQDIGYAGALRRFAAIVVHTGKTLAHLEALGVDRARILHLPHPPLLLEAGEQNDPLPPALPGQTTVLLWGAIKPYKGLDVLVRAVVEHLPADAPVRIVVAGRPFFDLGPLRSRIDSSAWKERFVFDLGFLPEARLDAWLHAADVVVFPYRQVDGSGALAAAARYGKPIVASAVGAFAEHPVRNQIELVPPNDPPALAAALRALIDDPARRAAAGRRAGAIAELLPSWDRFAQACLELYATPVSENGRVRATTVR